jgi:hypothetical protein
MLFNVQSMMRLYYDFGRCVGPGQVSRHTATVVPRIVTTAASPAPAVRLQHYRCHQCSPGHSHRDNAGGW